MSSADDQISEILPPSPSPLCTPPSPPQIVSTVATTVQIAQLEPLPFPIGCTQQQPQHQQTSRLQSSPNHMTCSCHPIHHHHHPIFTQQEPQAAANYHHHHHHHTQQCSSHQRQFDAEQQDQQQTRYIPSNISNTSNNLTTSQEHCECVGRIVAVNEPVDSGHNSRIISANTADDPNPSGSEDSGRKCTTRNR